MYARTRVCTCLCADQEWSLLPSLRKQVSTRELSLEVVTGLCESAPSVLRERGAAVVSRAVQLTINMLADPPQGGRKRQHTRSAHMPVFHIAVIIPDWFVFVLAHPTFHTVRALMIYGVRLPHFLDAGVSVCVFRVFRLCVLCVSDDKSFLFVCRRQNESGIMSCVITRNKLHTCLYKGFGPLLGVEEVTPLKLRGGDCVQHRYYCRRKTKGQHRKGGW